MAESDPKKIRPFGQSSDRRHLDSDEDPLVELARIVSEDSGFYGSRAERPKPQREERIDRNAYSADLESELLHELESSFSRSTAPRVAPAAARQAPQPQPQPVAPPLDDSDDLLRSIERQLGEFERRTKGTGSPSPLAAPPPQPAWESHDEQLESEQYEPDQAEHVETTRRVDFADRRVAEARERISSVRPPERQRERLPDRNPDRSAVGPQTGADPRIGRLFAGSPDGDAEEGASSRLPLRRRDQPPSFDGDRGRAPLRGGLAAGTASGWDRIENDDADAVPLHGDRDWRGGESELPTDTRPTFDAIHQTREAGHTGRDEPVRRDIVSDRTAYSEDIQPRYADPVLGGNWQDRDVSGQDGSEDDAHLAVTSARGVDERGDVPDRRRSRAVPIAAAVALGVLVVGGAAAMYMRNADEAPSGPPPVIAAAEGDVKVAPEAQAPAEAETVGDAVYNRVAGNAPAAEEQVVDGAEEPREISRIVLPSPQEEPDQALVKPVGEAERPAEPAAPGEVAADVAPTDANLGPRRVRTYVVRPDGTIAETSGTAAAPAGPPVPQQQVAAATAPDAEPMVPVRVPTTAINRARQPEPAEAGSGAPSAPQSPPSQVAAADPAAAPAAPDRAPAAAPPAEEPEPAPAATAEFEAEPEPAAPPPATTAAAVTAAEPAPPAAAPATDGYVVQISSQRSMADAQSSWASAQRRYASVLGNMKPDIQQADLGAKGTYYRVRVGPWASRGEAVQVCERLRAAGGDCIVTR